MPTVKIGELPNASCGHPEHNPPQHIVWPNGVYRHTCPRCKAVQVFTVSRPRYEVVKVWGWQEDAPMLKAA